jgi:hypothetical protein
MPYITQNTRKRYDTLIDDVVNKLSDKYPVDHGNDFDEGDLNYIVSKICWTLFDKSPSYSKANKIVGALECIKQEFIRRKVNPYEDDKSKQNGDI